MDIISVKDPERFNISKEIGMIINNSVLLMKNGQFNEAVSLCDEGLKLDSTNVLILTQKGTAFSRLSKFADAYYNKATVRALQGNISETLSLLE